jgi:hypothetical protein
MITEVIQSGPDSSATEFPQKQQMISRLKSNPAQAQAKIKKFADNKRTERKFNLRDMVYLKLQPFRLTAFGINQHIKLSTKFYGPFRIIEKIGPAAYKLQLPESADIHPVFHVSQLKQHLGPKSVPQDNLPLVTKDGYIRTEPHTVLDTRALHHRDGIVTQWLIQWQGLSKGQDSWEDKLFIKATFTNFYQQTLKKW